MLCNWFFRLKSDLDVLERYEEEKNYIFSMFSRKDCSAWHPAWPLLKRPSAQTLKSCSSRWLESSFTYTRDVSQPSERGRQRTLNSVHGHRAALLQSNGNITVWMSQRSSEWRECYIMTLSTIYWVPVQDNGSNILYLYEDKTRYTRSNITLCLKEFPRRKPNGIPEHKG